MNREIAGNLLAASQAAGRPFSVVSRSDSTLRGHFPGEVEALVGALNQTVDGILILPFFEEGGRFTIDDVHYVAESISKSKLKAKMLEIFRQLEASGKELIVTD